MTRSPSKNFLSFWPPNLVFLLYKLPFSISYACRALFLFFAIFFSVFSLLVAAAGLVWDISKIIKKFCILHSLRSFLCSFGWPNKQAVWENAIFNCKWWKKSHFGQNRLSQLIIPNGEYLMMMVVVVVMVAVVQIKIVCFLFLINFSIFSGYVIYE